MKGINILHLTTFITLSISFAFATQNCDVQPYNDGLKTLAAFKDGYIKYVSYNETSRCIKVIESSFNKSIKSADYTGTYRTVDSPTYRNFSWHQTIEACPEILHTVYDHNPTFTVELRVIFSDYKSCEVIKDPSRQYGCRLWVFGGATQAGIAECEAAYAASCGLTRHALCTKELCGSCGK